MEILRTSEVPSDKILEEANRVFKIIPTTIIEPSELVYSITALIREMLGI